MTENTSLNHINFSFEEHNSIIAETALYSNGWQPGRRVPIAKFCEYLSQHGFSVHDKAREFLSEFYGIGISFVNNYAWKKEEEIPDLLCERFIGFGVNPSYEIFHCPDIEVHGGTFIQKRKSIEIEVGSLICPIGYLFSRSCWKGKRPGIKNLFRRKNDLPLVASMMPQVKTPASYYYMLEDGRIFEPNDHATTIFIYKDYKHLISNEYRISSKPLLDQYRLMNIEDDYLDF